ncbi:serine/threonine-protein kinase [Anaeromyxobacter dehalogenans]|uniref:Serine/threonine protein kinase n=1 Tax=Anaeromyxobacter dehalogenans (strain 2CP-C) TaxID=290397 RepID=Q2IIW5_ANADE|nr:serine/threonine-protein kinase [Anaeromyxobacter dehalogenans]ABC81592.1 serine/threonine protein kinase [Anaeromyxobacter dehalogenans 2CP-C]
MPEEKATLPLPGATPPVGGRAPAPETLTAGAFAGDWQLIRSLAAGGHGVVYLAAHRATGRRAAVKVLSHVYAASPEMASRFVREARILSRLSHPNVVEILELGALADGRPFVAMELLEGRSLLELVFARGRLSLPEAVELLAPVCAALDAAHQAGVVHRDVKASNVFVETGDPPRVKLLDFGVAHAAGPDDPSITVTGERLGSAHAMAPELIRGEAVDARADVYALGVLLYQLLTGELPFWSEDQFELERLHLSAPPPRPGRLAPVPTAVDAVVERALAKRPDERFGSAPAFLEALRSAAGLAGQAEEHAARAAVLHVSLAPARGLEPGDVLALLELEDAAAGRLATAGWEIDVRAGGTLLATRVLPASPEAARAARADAAELGAGLSESLARAAGARCRVEVCLHAGEIRLGPGERRAGGAVYRIAEWVRDAPGGFAATAQALEGLSAGR